MDCKHDISEQAAQQDVLTEQCLSVWRVIVFDKCWAVEGIGIQGHVIKGIVMEIWSKKGCTWKENEGR